MTTTYGERYPGMDGVRVRDDEDEPAPDPLTTKPDYANWTVTCPECGSDRVLAVEKIYHHIPIEGIDSDGHFEYDGPSTVFWDTTEAVTDDETGLPLLHCGECDNEWGQDEPAALKEKTK